MLTFRLHLGWDNETTFGADDELRSALLRCCHRREPPDPVKEHVMVPNAQQTGRAAAASGVLMVLGVEGEWLLDPQRDDGSVANMPVFALLLLVATAGFSLLLLTVRGLGAQATLSRRGRAGAMTSQIGAGLLVASGLAVLGTSVVTGRPNEASYVAFLLGLLLLSIGSLTWGVSLRSSPIAPGVPHAVSVAGVAGLGALLVEPDPWHDLILVAAFLAWSALGLLLLRHRNQPADGRSGRSTNHRIQA